MNEEIENLQPYMTEAVIKKIPCNVCDGSGREEGESFCEHCWGQCFLESWTWEIGLMREEEDKNA